MALNRIDTRVVRSPHMLCIETLHRVGAGVFLGQFLVSPSVSCSLEASSLQHYPAGGGVGRRMGALPVSMSEKISQRPSDPFRSARMNFPMSGSPRCDV